MRRVLIYRGIEIDIYGLNFIRELKGVMDDFKADQGLLVSWGGFKQSVINDSRRRFFEIRLWDAGDLVNAILEHYDQLSKDLQAELICLRLRIL